MKLRNLINEFIPGKDMEGNSEQESVNEASSDEKLYKDLLKQRAYAVRKGQTTLVNSLHKEIEKLVRKMRKSESVNLKKFGAKDVSKHRKTMYKFPNAQAYDKAREFLKKNNVPVNNYNSIDYVIQLEESVNESDAYTLHRLANNVGSGTAEEFLSKHNIDLKLLAKAIQQGTINKFELKDIVKGVAHKYDVKRFMDEFVKESVNESKFKKGQTVKYIVPGTSNKMKKGKITGFESTRDEDFAVIDGKTISFSHISESIKEAEDQWTGKDLIDTAKALVLARKSVEGAIRNLNKLEKQLAKFKNKPQGNALYSMLPGRGDLLKMGTVLAKLAKLDQGMGAMFTKAWDMLKKKSK